MSRRIPRSAKKRTRLTATPDSSPVVSENDLHSAGGGLIPAGAGAAQDVEAAEVRASEAGALCAGEMPAEEGAGEHESPNRVNRT
ncbi:MAG: hypothetical protein L0211_25160, partial [Planctomycetaceae bacterium]|nr:hypothetical protein [Planctomycetaceae bacterium]